MHTPRRRSCVTRRAAEARGHATPAHDPRSCTPSLATRRPAASTPCPHCTTQSSSASGGDAPKPSDSSRHLAANHMSTWQTDPDSHPCWPPKKSEKTRLSPLAAKYPGMPVGWLKIAADPDLSAPDGAQLARAEAGGQPAPKGSSRASRARLRTPRKTRAFGLAPPGTFSTRTRPCAATSSSTTRRRRRATVRSPPAASAPTRPSTSGALRPPLHDPRAAPPRAPTRTYAVARL